MSTFHIIGGGLAGLASAVKLCEQNFSTIIYEASSILGGRARSFTSKRLGATIDNGSHLVLGANKATLEWIQIIGAQKQFITSNPPVFPFIDLATQERWDFTPDIGVIPWKMLSAIKKIPAVSIKDYRILLKLLFASSNKTVAQCLAAQSSLYEYLFKPMAESMLNTPADIASATLLRDIFSQLLFSKGKGFVPYVIKNSLADSFIDPARHYIQRHNGKIHVNTRIKSIEYDMDKAVALIVNDERIELSETDKVIIATPANVTPKLIPNIKVPTTFHPIVNVHFRYKHKNERPYLGIINGVAQWLFFRPDIISTTISVADELVKESNERIASKVWSDVQHALCINDPLPDYHIIKERHATFSQTPEALTQRPKQKTLFSNVALAGDYTDTGLSATIESAVLSGFLAVAIVR